MDLQENIYKKVEKPTTRGRWVVGFGDLSIDIFLEVQNEKYSSILYLIEYNAHGVHFCSKINNFKENRASGVKKMF